MAALLTETEMTQKTRRVRSATAPEAAAIPTNPLLLQQLLMQQLQQQSAAAAPQPPSTNHAGAQPLPPDVAQKLLMQMMMGQGGAQPATQKEMKKVAQYLVPVGTLQLSKEQKDMLAEIADGAGHPIIAKALRGEQVKDGFWTTMKEVGSKNVKVRHVVYAVAIGAIAFLVWEGIAYKFDLPRFGFWDPSSGGRR